MNFPQREFFCKIKLVHHNIFHEKELNYLPYKLQNTVLVYNDKKIEVNEEVKLFDYKNLNLHMEYIQIIFLKV